MIPDNEQRKAATQVICGSDKDAAPLFCETHPIFSVAIEAPLRTILEGEAAKIPKTIESSVIARAAALW